jgi:hypothetical protein
MSRRWQQRAALFLFIVYSLDLAWKLANWRESFGGVPLWGIALGLTFRFAFMGFILSMYLRLRRVPQEPPLITKAVKHASVRSIRLFHVILIVAIVGYISLAEWLPRPTANAPALIVESFSVLAILMVAVAFGFRRKLLPSAIEKLRCDAGDATPLGRWRMANVLSMSLVMSVALCGFVLRILGGDRRVVWPFFLVSVTLMLLWRPRLDEGASSTDTSPPQPN